MVLSVDWSGDRGIGLRTCVIVFGAVLTEVPAGSCAGVLAGYCAGLVTWAGAEPTLGVTLGPVAGCCAGVVTRAGPGETVGNTGALAGC